MQTSQVIIVGANARPLAQSARRAGYQVIAVDQFADFDTCCIAETVSQANLAGLLADSRTSSPPYYSAYVGGWENQIPQVLELESASMMLGNRASVLQRLANKYALFDWIRDQGFRVPRVIPESEIKPYLNANSTKKPQPFLRKKLMSCGGLDIQSVVLAGFESSHWENARYQQEPKVGDEKYWYQELIPGQSLSANYLAFLGPEGVESHCLGLTRQLSGDKRFNATGFSYTGSLMEPDPDHQVMKVATALGQSLAEEFQLFGLFNIDFVVSNQEVYFLEVNPRYSASMELWELTSGVSLFELQRIAFETGLHNSPNHVERIRSLVDELTSLPYSMGKAVWYADDSFHVNHHFARFACQANEQNDQLQIADIPHPGTPIKSGHPVFTVFASGNSSGHVNEKLCETAKIFSSPSKLKAPKS